jgi:DNA excision repair protein ERCC-2
MIEKDQIDRIRISVRNLVEFILRSGDLDNRRSNAPENAMQEGSKIHRQIQKRMGLNYEAEVSMKACFAFEEFELLVEGRADGIITDQDGDRSSYIRLTKSKAHIRNWSLFKQPYAVHLAQAKCYAYMLCKEKQLEKIKVRMTYCNIDTQEIKYFVEEFNFQVIDFLVSKTWLTNTINGLS